MGNSLLIIGCGGQGRSVLDCALSVGKYDEIAFVVSNKPDVMLPDFIYYQEYVDFDKYKFYSDVVIAVGDNSTREKKFIEYLNSSFNIATLIHKNAYVSSRSKIGKGTVVFANASVNINAEIGDNCIINTGCVVEHDCKIGNNVHLSPNVALGGTVYIGNNVWVGLGSAVKNCIKIGEASIIGLGSAVVKDIPDHCLAYGNPCRKVKSI